MHKILLNLALLLALGLVALVKTVFVGLETETKQGLINESFLKGE